MGGAKVSVICVLGTRMYRAQDVAATCPNTVQCCGVYPSEILESPVGIQTVPLGSNATFSCRTTGLLVWRVGSAQILHPSQISNLAKQKIYITGDSVPDENSGLEHSSTVIITGTRDNNVTMLWCLVTFDLLQYNESDPGILYTFGKLLHSRMIQLYL